METDRTRKKNFLIFVLAILLSIGLTPAKTAKSEPAKSEPAHGEGATIHQRIALMSDEEVRKTLIDTMQEQEQARTTGQDEAVISGPGAILGTLLHILGRETDITQKKLRTFVDNIPDSGHELSGIFLSLSPNGSLGGAIRNISYLFFFICLGLVAEKIVKVMLRQKYYRLSSGKLDNLPVADADMTISEKLVATLVTILPSLLGLVVFFAAAYFSYFTFVWTDSPSLKLLFLAVLLGITTVRIIAILAVILLSPTHRRFRLLPLSCGAAMTGYRIMVWIGGYIVTVILFALVVYRLGARPETVVTIKLFAATLLLAVTAAAVVYYRKPVAVALLAPSPEETEPEPLSWGKQNLAPIWHLLALLYLASLWCLLIMSIVDPAAPAKGAFLLSFFVLPIWLLADRVLQWLVKHTLLSLRLYEESPASPPAGERGEPDSAHAHTMGKTLFTKVNHYARLALIIGVALWLASLWGYTIPVISKLTGVLFDSLIIMALALVFWQFISSRIERKIKESLPESTVKRDDVDDEWGDVASQGRSYTLLPIIRSFVASILVIMVTLTILSSLGVDIGPLLAGAGVVGLAVGFGAQKIVSDIFSGIFYLLDDAFRVGEYLTAGGIMGTVEKISLRNVMLRHHRGMLQIVPYSSLGTITNYMRGGIIEKFSLDFAYDADIDKIRKIIKKVGQEMLEDPELGKNFIRPLRSQGVREITNSVMTIRVKFTAKPGSQFVIRREAFKRITAAMHARGIQYAHKKVIVDLPEPLTGHENPAQLQKITRAAGAAAREIFDEEEKLKRQLAEQKSEA